eukprot:6123623-Amphidinium_carterae.2
MEGLAQVRHRTRTGVYSDWECFPEPFSLQTGFCFWGLSRDITVYVLSSTTQILKTKERLNAKKRKEHESTMASVQSIRQTTVPCFAAHSFTKTYLARGPVRA